MNAMGYVLEFDGVTKEYRTFLSDRRFCALDNFNLQVEAGEIFGFLGPNGAGKTTAIHLAMGFMRPTRGSGRLLGEPFGSAAARRRVGFLPENIALYPRRAEQLVRFYGAINGMKAEPFGRLPPGAGGFLPRILPSIPAEQSNSCVFMEQSME